MQNFFSYLISQNNQNLVTKYQFYKNQEFSELSFLLCRNLNIIVVTPSTMVGNDIRFKLLENYIEDINLNQYSIRINYIDSLDCLNFAELKQIHLFIIDNANDDTVSNVQVLQQCNYQPFLSSITNFYYLVSLQNSQSISLSRQYFQRTSLVDSMNLIEDLNLLNHYYKFFLFNEKLEERKKNQEAQSREFHEKISRLEKHVAKLSEDNNKLSRRYDAVKGQLSYRIGNALVTSFKDKKTLVRLPITLLNQTQDFYQQKGEIPKFLQSFSANKIFNSKIVKKFPLSKTLKALANLKIDNEKSKNNINKNLSDATKTLNNVSSQIGKIQKEQLLSPVEEIKFYLDKRIDYLSKGDTKGFYQYTQELIVKYDFKLFEGILPEILQILYFEESKQLSQTTKQFINQFFDYYLQQRNTAKIALHFLDFVDVMGFDEVLNYLDRNRLAYKDIFIENQFLDLIIQKPQAMQTYLFPDFYSWLAFQPTNPEIFSIRYNLALLNGENIDSHLAEIFFDIKKSKNKNRFLGRIQRYSYLAKKLIQPEFFDEALLAKIKKYEDVLYVSLMLSRETNEKFVKKFTEKVMSNKDALSISKLDEAYIASQTGDNSYLVKIINESFDSDGIAPLSNIPSADIKTVYLSLLKPEQQITPIKEDGKISVILSTNEPNIELLRLSIESILNQSYQNLELYVVDDASTNGQDIEMLLKSKNDDRAHYIKMLENSGVYNCRNHAMEICNGDYIAFQDDDDVSHLQRLAYQINQLRDKNISVSMTSSLRIDEGGYIQMDNNQSIISNAPVTMMFKRDLIDKIGGFKSFRSRGDVEFKSRVVRLLGPSSISLSPAILYYSLGMHKSLSSSFEHGRNISNLKLIRSLITYDKTLPNVARLHSTSQDDQMVVCMASFPARKEKMLATIDSIAPHVDKLYLYLNNYDTVPEELSKYSNITTVLGVNAAGDLRDNGKIYPFKVFDIRGYCFLIDDDIVYPVSYFNELANKVDYYHRKAVVGVHGVIFAKPFVNYFENRTVFHFKHENLRDVVVNQLGTGALCFHSSTLKPDLDKYLATGMADVFFAIQAKEQGIPLVCVSHPAQWLMPLDIEIEDNANLYDEFKHNHNLQTEFIKSAGEFTEISIASIV